MIQTFQERTKQTRGMSRIKGKYLTDSGQRLYFVLGAQTRQFIIREETEN
ncbi:Hypothetical protein FKW44_008256 [Caligus rogercresseyi]|uniref:Uncharacterized protein n=1 Tax=Caligus rogercresseyi TaxID=217165 RepID=A0A7T8QU47_CALRO|nr:Hypothetical protein FKW44_008256 [Caligus rogercresseyi]